MYLLGISAFYHDSAAAIIHNGKIIAAAQEERFTRKKHDAGFPRKAIQYCIAEANIQPSELENIVFYEKPFLKFERLLETYLAFAPRGFTSFYKAMPIWIKEKLFQKSKIVRELNELFGKTISWDEKLLFSDHHLSHASSAFFPSPFKSAAILTLDGVGEWTTTSCALGKENTIKTISEIHFPHSVGLLYSAFTFFLGFKVNSGEYKVMGLAPYGKPIYSETIKQNLIELSNDGSFHINMSYFNYATGLTMTNSKFHRLFGCKPRPPETALTQKHMDLAASIQNVTEEIILKIAKNLQKQTQKSNLCLAGGVALNCVANGILLREKIFKKIWIQPASGDAGGAIGAALAAWHIHFKNKRTEAFNTDSMNGSFLGPQFTNDEIEVDLTSLGAVYKKFTKLELIELVSKELASGKIIGWMQGRMEFGPRALGARSIIADPRSPKMQRQLNLKIKYRESFRPFAPSVLEEDVTDFFEHKTSSKYMLFVAKVKKNKHKAINKKDNKLNGIDRLSVPRTTIPAVTHVDYSARIQTVDKETNPLFHQLITSFKQKTSCPMVVNTSFNVRGEPIVCTPADAFRCFMGTEIDVLAIGDFVLLKSEQNQSAYDYKAEYDLD